jgi:DNA-binding response OmpR family regulator
MEKDDPMSPQPRVLVAEDEPLIWALVSMAFEAEGYDVDTAADGAEALAKACQQPPQAVVLDLMMPVMDGWDFLAAWQCQPTSQAVPVVVISAGDHQADQAPLGVQAFLTKPVDIDRLVATVTALVEPESSVAGSRAM